MFKIEFPYDVNNLIFDLDGTLIDSVDSILFSLKFALEANNTVPLVELNSSLIGPPLNELITTTTGIRSDCPKFNAIKFSFQQHYDSVGYLNSKLFPGVFESLNNYFLSGKKIWIATNKRKYPTYKILEFYKLLSFVNKIYTLDSFNPPLSGKSELLQSLINKENLLPEQCVFVGDRKSDEYAAARIKMNYIMVPWGYEL